MRELWHVHFATIDGYMYIALYTVYSSLLLNLCYWTHTLNELHVLTDIYASCVFMTAWRGQRSVCEVDYPLHELYIGPKAQGVRNKCAYITPGLSITVGFIASQLACNGRLARCIVHVWWSAVLKSLQLNKHTQLQCHLVNANQVTCNFVEGGRGWAWKSSICMIGPSTVSVCVGGFSTAVSLKQYSYWLHANLVLSRERTARGQFRPCTHIQHAFCTVIQTVAADQMYMGLVVENMILAIIVCVQKHSLY